MTRMDRRSFLKIAGTCSMLPFVQSPFGMQSLIADESKPPYRVGVCGWNMPGYAGNLESFAMAKKLGFQGVQLLYDPMEEPVFTKKENQDRFLQAAQEEKMEIMSFSIGIVCRRPFATDPDAEQWVSGCLEAMHDMQIKNLLLPFFGEGDLIDKPDDQKRTVAKLKNLVPQAEKLGRTISIESYLTVGDHLRMIDGVGSDAVKVYYDFQNMADKGYDIFEDLKILGPKNLISEVHLKDNTHRLIDSPLNYFKISEALQESGYRGWVIVEASISGDWQESYASNADFARKIFSIR